MDTASAQEIAMLKAAAEHDVDEHIRREIAAPRNVSRKVARQIKRDAKHAEYAKAGLNGRRAMVRRFSQRASGHNDQSRGFVQ